MGLCPPRVRARHPVSACPEKRVFSFLRRARNIICFAALAACDSVPQAAGSPTGIAVIDDDGRSVTLAQPAERIASLVPSATETLLLLGAADRIVLRTTYDGDARLAHVPAVPALRPTAESILAAAPDLVIAQPDDQAIALVAALERAGVPVYAAYPRSLDDAHAAIVRLGALVGMPNTADSAAAALADELGAVRRMRAGRNQPSILYVLWHEPLRTAGRETFIHELIETAGARNIFADVAEQWPLVSMEEVVRREPGFLVFNDVAGAPTLEQLRAGAGWRELRAVRAGRVLYVDNDLFSRPGPRVGEAARALARMIDPEIEP